MGLVARVTFSAFAFLIISTPRASAFPCAAANLPWDVVVCADPELQRLADQRLQAFEQAKTRLNPTQVDQLRKDQAAWVPSYSASCGILAGTVPQPPIPADVIACFKKAGEARLAYLLAYGRPPAPELAPPQAAQPTADKEPATANTVALVRSGGTYAVPVRINQAITLRFIVDSGASDVSVPADVVMTLIRTGTIANSDFIGDQRYRLADGSTVKSAQFLLRELQVGDQSLHNVIASVAPVESTPLLGQSFLSHFSSWTLDNERHLLVLGSAHSATFQRALNRGVGDVNSKNGLVPASVPKLMASQRWLVVASRNNLQDAITTAKEFKQSFPETAVVKSVNGQYGVTIGRYDIAQQPRALGDLINSGRVPRDAYLTLGERFVAVVNAG